MQNRLCTISIGRKYELLNIKDSSIVEVIAYSKKDACEKLGVKPHQYRVLSSTDATKEVLFHTQMTNAEVIKILAQRDPNAPCEIMCDFATDHQSREYDLIDPEDGMCYDTSKGLLFFSRGECW
jgi:hypothetical protein